MSLNYLNTSQTNSYYDVLFNGVAQEFKILLQRLSQEEFIFWKLYTSRVFSMTSSPVVSSFLHQTGGGSVGKQ